VPQWRPTEHETAEGSPVAELVTERGAYAAAMDGQYLADGLAAVWRSIARANEYVDRRAPWKLAKDPGSRQELEHTLATLAWLLAWQAVLVCPVMPAKAQELWEQLGAPGEVSAVRWGEDADPTRLLDPTGWRVRKGKPLFPKEAEREKVSQ
jgi:methionyl-tRNA synthetase